MLESHLSRLSSLKDDFKMDDYVQPHYRESYRLAIDALVSGGQDAYQEVLKVEKVGAFLSEAELLFITHSTEKPAEGHHSGEVDGSPDSQSSSGTYWPTHSDVPTPNLELGWPNFIHDRIQTKVELLFHPPRQNSPTIKEVIRKHIQDAQEVIAIAMDVFTDVDIFKELVDASARGVPVYVLLDHTQFKSFLTMAESQDIHIRKLTNMRVRTVKGQDYLCRTGAKFHGNMEQRFLLVDCRTVFFGSYSLMWSYEKINLSMIQVITGHLVASYDEEFRTLYARSTVPPELAPLNSMVNERNQGGRVESDAFERKHQLRHTLNTVYRQACERKDFGSRVGGIEEHPLNYEPFNRESRMAHHQQHDYVPAMEAMSYQKRHSYAGERQEGTYTPAYMRHGASNWNIAGNRGYGTHGRYQLHGGYNDPHHAPPLDNARGSYIRQSYHGIGKQLQSMQKNMPNLDQVTKSYMRDWRVESYLNNSDAPIMESHDHLDQLDLPENRPSLHLHSRLRSSIVLKAVIPEQTEMNSYTDASSSSVRCRDQYGFAPSNYTQSPPSIKWNNHEPVDYRAMHDDFLLKRRSLQILDEPKCSGTGNSSGRDYLRSCTSLGRVRGRMVHQEVDAQQEALYKRHSVSDPKSSKYVGHRESSNPTLGALMRACEHSGSPREKAGGWIFAEDQHSVSHRNLNGSAVSKASSNSTWQESPSRTVSTTLLQDREQERSKSSSISSPQFLKKSSRKIKSLLNIADKKDGSPKSRLRSLRKVGGGSSDTIVLEEEQQADDDREEKACSSTADSAKSTGGPGWWRSHNRLHSTDPKDILSDVGRSSAPRFSTEGIDQSPTAGSDAQRAPSQQSNAHSVRSSATTREARHWDQYGDSRRFGSSKAPEREPAGYSQRNDTSTNSQASYRYRGLIAAKKDHTDRTNYSDRNAHFSHDNKLGRLFQRVGNFIHKKT